MRYLFMALGLAMLTLALIPALKGEAPSSEGES